ncbi:2Fe-2S iron-sulfur cluster-binding protein [Pseudomonadota bacterium]
MINFIATDLEGQEHELQARPDERLMEVLREQDWGVAAICGGMCSCATCHVWVDEEWLDRFPPKDVEEEELLEFLDQFKANSRLSCQLILQPQHNGLRVTLAPEE